MSSPTRERLGLGVRDDASFTAITDRSVMARALMYLLVAVGTAIVGSIAIPNAPLHHENAVVVLAAIAYAAAIGVFFGFERLPAWAIHAVLFGVTALISWSVYASDRAGNPYTIFFVWVALYSAYFFGPRGAALQVVAMLTGFGVALVVMDSASDQPELHWAMTASALILLAVAIQALTGRVGRLVERLTEIGRTDSVTGLYNAAAYVQMLDNEVERARRSGNRMAIVVAELDDFGPVGGGPLTASQQQLLGQVGAIFSGTPRQIDMAARLRDARFGLLLPYTDEHGAYLLAERLHERVAALNGGHARMSFGVAAFPRHGANAAAVSNAAQVALDEGREAGGDRVMVFQRSASSARVEIDLTDVPDEQIG